MKLVPITDARTKVTVCLNPNFIVAVSDRDGAAVVHLTSETEVVTTVDLDTVLGLLADASD
jgi:hypothetical protein